MLLILVLLSLSFGITCSSGGHKLMLILLDGFRWDYFENIELLGFQKFQEIGVKAEYMDVDFPTISLPNYYSVLTG